VFINPATSPGSTHPVNLAFPPRAFFESDTLRPVTGNHQFHAGEPGSDSRIGVDDPVESLVRHESPDTQDARRVKGQRLRPQRRRNNAEGNH